MIFVETIHFFDDDDDGGDRPIGFQAGRPIGLKAGNCIPQVAFTESLFPPLIT